jgi:hypothetical protein
MEAAPVSFLEAALAYAARGWPVLPLAPRKKLPLIAERDGGHGVHDATLDVARITAWWHRAPLANIGIACGSVSGIDVLDIDPRNQGNETLAALEREHGVLPEAPVAFTGGGGCHVLLAHVDGIRGTATALGSGIEVKSVGGYVVAPPSIHPSGRPYAWDVDHHPDNIAPPVPPRWLRELLGAGLSNNGRRQCAEPSEWTALMRDGLERGARNTKLTRLAGMLLRKNLDSGVVFELLRAFNEARCRPPLSERDVATIFTSIGKRELARRAKERGGH